MGLGPLRSITLAEARGRAAEARLLRDRGIDPIEDRRAKIQAATPVKKVDGPTFREFAPSYIDGRRDEWKHKKTESDWRSSLERYAFPVIGNLPVEAIQTSHIIEILQPIWKTKSETASRLRGRIERVLAAASVEGLRQGNCAVFKGHLAEARAGALSNRRGKARKAKFLRLTRAGAVYELEIGIRVRRRLFFDLRWLDKRHSEVAPTLLGVVFVS